MIFDIAKNNDFLYNTNNRKALKGVFQIKSIVKNTVVHLRTGFKFALLLVIGAAIISFLIFVVYKPMYSVTLNGKFLGYTSDKSELQGKISEYVKSGDNQTVAFVEIEELPDYKMCLLKKGLTANDEEILANVISTGTPYYKYYAVTENGVEKCYVSNYTEADSIIHELKQKNSDNKDIVSYKVKYDTVLSDFTDTQTAIASLYRDPPVNAKVPATTTTGKNTVVYKNLGLAAIQQPISGRITSRFGANSRIRVSSHTGLDIAASTGTPVIPIAAGKVTFSGRKGSYGNLVIVNHGKNASGQEIESWYAHNVRLNVSAGQQVDENTVISNVGSTGNSTGPHLHLEIRINGWPVNPQNYLYN